MRIPGQEPVQKIYLLEGRKGAKKEKVGWIALASTPRPGVTVMCVYPVK